MTRWEEWRHIKKTILAPKWDAWLKKHGKHLNAAGKKEYWRKRKAFMRKQRAEFMQKWRKAVGKKNKVANKAAMKWWWKQCLAKK